MNNTPKSLIKLSLITYEKISILDVGKSYTKIVAGSTVFEGTDFWSIKDIKSILKMLGLKPSKSRNVNELSLKTAKTNYFHYSKIFFIFFNPWRPLFAKSGRPRCWLLPFLLFNAFDSVKSFLHSVSVRKEFLLFWKKNLSLSILYLLK